MPIAAPAAKHRSKRLAPRALASSGAGTESHALFAEAVTRGARFVAFALYASALSGCFGQSLGAESADACGLSLAIHGASDAGERRAVAKVLTCDLLRTLPPRAEALVPPERAAAEGAEAATGIRVIGTLPQGVFTIVLPEASAAAATDTPQPALRRRVVEAMADAALPDAPRTRAWLARAVSHSGPGLRLVHRAQRLVALYVLTVILPADLAWPHALEVAEFIRFLSLQEGAVGQRYPELFRHLNATDSLEAAFPLAYDMSLNRGLSLWRTQLTQRLRWLPWLVTSACILLLLGAMLWRRRGRRPPAAPRRQPLPDVMDRPLPQPNRTSSTPPPTYH